MATSSFFDTYYITKDDVERFHEIMFGEVPEVIFDEIPDCQEISAKDLFKKLGLTNNEV